MWCGFVYVGSRYGYWYAWQRVREHRVPKAVLGALKVCIECFLLIFHQASKVWEQESSFLALTCSSVVQTFPASAGSFVLVPVKAAPRMDRRSSAVLLGCCTLVCFVKKKDWRLRLAAAPKPIIATCLVSRWEILELRGSVSGPSDDPSCTLNVSYLTAWITKHVLDTLEKLRVVSQFTFKSLHQRTTRHSCISSHMQQFPFNTSFYWAICGVISWKKKVFHIYFSTKDDTEL